MVNQNPEPIILSKSIEVQAKQSTDAIELNHNMATPEMMDIFALYVYIYPGYLNIGPNSDYPLGRLTWTDIDPIYIPTINNAARPNDSEEPTPFYVTLPVCCNPRTWTDLTLEILVGSNPVPSKVIHLGGANAKLDRTIPFSTPIKVKWNQRVFIKVQNNNPATPAFNTWSKLDVVLNGEIVNYEQLRKEQAIARARASE